MQKDGHGLWDPLVRSPLYKGSPIERAPNAMLLIDERTKFSVRAEPKVRGLTLVRARWPVRQVGTTIDFDRPGKGRDTHRNCDLPEECLRQAVDLFFEGGRPCRGEVG